jgi:hypothetical protein
MGMAFRAECDGRRLRFEATRRNRLCSFRKICLLESSSQALTREVTTTPDGDHLCLYARACQRREFAACKSTRIFNPNLVS